MSTTRYETDFYAWAQLQATLTCPYTMAEVLERTSWP